MSFKFPCVYKLKKELGKLDTVAQLTEISVRQFLKLAEESGDIKSYIDKEAKVHQLQTDIVESALLIQRLSLQYISSVQQYAEYFYHQLREDYQDLFNHKIEIGDSNRSLLTKLVNKIPEVNLDQMSEGAQLYFEILEYYRKVRNKYSHQFTISDSSVQTAYDKLYEKKALIESEFKVTDAPNSYSELNFNDFMIFTKALKYFAQELCRQFSPNEELFIEYLKRNGYKKKYLQNEKRFKESIRTFLRAKHGITDLDEDKIHSALVAYW